MTTTDTPPATIAECDQRLSRLSRNRAAAVEYGHIADLPGIEAAIERLLDRRLWLQRGAVPA